MDMKRRHKRRDPRRCAGALTVSGYTKLKSFFSVTYGSEKRVEASTRVHLLLKKKKLFL